MPRRNRQPRPMRAPILMRVCSAKRKYRSENEARRMAEIQMLANMNLELTIYKCDVCDGWHLTRLHD